MAGFAFFCPSESGGKFFSLKTVQQVDYEVLHTIKLFASLLKGMKKISKGKMLFAQRFQVERSEEYVFRKKSKQNSNFDLTTLRHVLNGNRKKSREFYSHFGDVRIPINSDGLKNSETQKLTR